MSPEGAAWPPEGWEIVESETKGSEVDHRDELAKVLHEAAKAPCPIAFWSDGYGGPTGYGELFADAILAAGYSKHSEEVAKCKRAAKTLNEVIEKQCRDVLDVTGLHHLINEDGDGHWDAVWMRLFEMRDELADLKASTIARERKRGDGWRDRAQETESRAQTLEMELRAVNERAEAAEASIGRVRHLLDATAPDRYAILSMEGLRLGIRSALEEGEVSFEDDDWNAVDQ